MLPRDKATTSKKDLCKYNLLFLLALRADAEKIKPMVHNPITSFFCHFLRQFTQCWKVWISDFFALYADQMWVRIRSNSIISVGVVRKAKLDHLPQLFEQQHRLVEGGQAGRRKMHLHLLVDMLHAGMRLAIGQYLEHSQPLRRNPAITFFQCGNHMFETSLRISHVL